MKLMRNPLDEQVYEILQRRIVSGELRGGARLVQNELALEFGVSRIPVRDALRKLEATGLVSLDEKGNCHVLEFGRADLAEVYLLRRKLESLAIRNAAPLMTKSITAELEELCDAMARALGDDNFNAYAELNRDFHMVIYRTAQMPRTLRMIESLWSGVPPLTPIGVPGRMAQSLEEHARLLRALDGRDARAAEDLLVEHICNAEEQLQRHMNLMEAEVEP